MQSRVGLVVGVSVLVAMMFIPSTGVREIHNADRISNFVLVDPRPSADDWPWWRGANGQNVATSDRVPLRWPASNNDGWQVAITGPSRATPSLWGDQLFLLTADPGLQRISLQSHSRSSGRANWRTDLHQGGFQKLPDKNSYASATPACDGQFVYAVAPAHNGLWVTCVDLKGRMIWQREAGPFHSNHEYRSSPTMSGSLIIVVADQGSSSYLAALHRQTGDIIWRIKRPNGESSGTPIVATIAGRSQLIVGGKGTVSSYDPSTGDQIWTFRWSAERIENSIAFDDEHVFATSWRPEAEIVCIKADGSGDVTKSHLVWRQTKVAGNMPSPLYHAGLLYVLSDNGHLTCLNAETGQIECRKRLKGSFSASPVIAGKHLLCSNEEGLTYILETGVSCAITAENSLSEGIIASPIVAGDSIYIRTQSGLHRIVSSSSETVADTPELFKRRF